ncbi:MAG: glycosyltransferase family 9 protein [Chloroflexota bacterium]
MIDTPRSVVVLRALALGDLLCAVPTFRAMRRAWPDAHIALVGLPWSVEFVRRYGHYLDEHIEFPGYPGLPGLTVTPERLEAFLDEVAARAFDLAVQLHGDGQVTNALVARFGARRMASAHGPGGWPVRPGDVSVSYPSDAHEIHRALAVARAMGLPADDDRLEFPIRQADRDELAEAIARRDEAGRGLEPGRYAVVHPGAKAAERRWPAASFAPVADHLAGRGFRVVITGVEGERPVATALRAAMDDAHRESVLDLVGATTLGAVGALVDGASVVVSNDTGISHLAAATRTRSVVLSIAADPRRWAPLDRRLHRSVGTGDPSRPIAVEEVTAAIEGVLRADPSAMGAPHGVPACR